MNANKALWEKGDFTRIAECVRESGGSLVKELGITDGLQVLDLGCGDGTTALPAAQLGAEVLGVDIAANLVAAGKRTRPGPRPDQLHIPGGRCIGSARARRREL
jgi:2-polyprenyl-3-methyl-5-hydroxy-6-metoxy-1,4-benzoquinol methylase